MIFPQDWTGGVAFPPYGCIAIGISTSNLDLGQRRHRPRTDTSHYRADDPEPYNDIPTWLDEGLAMYNQGPLDSYICHQSKFGHSRKQAGYRA